MSFLPVSEALLRLEFEGLLESRPRAGTRVRIPSADDVHGHYLVRETLEVEAAKLFAEVASKAERAGAAADGRARRRAVAAGRPRAVPRRCTTSSTAASPNAPDVPCCRPPSNRPARCRPRGSACFRARRRRARRDGIGISRRRWRPARPREAAGAMRQHVRWSRHEALERLQPYFELRKSSGRTFSRSARRVCVIESGDDDSISRRELLKRAGARRRLVPVGALVSRPRPMPRPRPGPPTRVATRAARNAHGGGSRHARGGLRPADSHRCERPRRGGSARGALHRSRARRRVEAVAASVRRRAWRRSIAYASSSRGARVRRAGAGRPGRVLQDVAAGAAPGLPNGTFFALVRTHTIEGTFCDPLLRR